METEIYDDHVYAKPPPGRQRIINDDHFNAIFRNKTEEDMQGSSSVSKADVVSKVGTTMKSMLNAGKKTGL